MADVEDADTGPDGHVLIDDSATDGRGILDGHVPTVEFHHLGAHLAMDGVERSLTNGGRFNRRQERPQSASSGGCRDVWTSSRTDYRITPIFGGSNRTPA